MTYPEAILFLYNLRVFGTKLGLENTLELARLAGNPQQDLRFIHVAGTNGKGSTCAILESIYRADGHKTGLFTSPHLVSFTERIQVNRVCISEGDVARNTERLIELLGGADLSRWTFRPTFFEFVTVMALLYFRERECSIILWETGMGGRLDATNIVHPLATIITNVQLDHQQWLGSTLAEIAAEKAGIIKPGVPVITGAEGPALEVVRAMAEAKNAPLRMVTPPVNLPCEVSLRGEHQRFNAAVALAAVEAVNGEIAVPASAIKEGLRTVDWSGRLQLVRRGECEVLLDGAHNTDGAKTLREAVLSQFQDRKIALVLGLFRDKPWEEICRLLVPLATRVLLVPLHSERTVDVTEVQQFCIQNWPEKRIELFESAGKALESAIMVSRERFVLVSGSLHLIGEAMEWLHIHPGERSERLLNEWDAANSAR